MQRTDPIRWVCPVCLKVERRRLILQETYTQKFAAGKLRLIEPRHCNRFLLLAGEPKKDVHGLVDENKDTMIDPVDNLKLTVVS